jgi:hypothetical protein
METTRSMQSAQNHFTAFQEISDNSPFSLAILLSKLFQFTIDVPSFTPIPRFSDRSLFAIHLCTDVGHYRCGFASLSQYLKTVIQHTREQASRMAKTDHWHLVRSESLYDIVDADIARTANQQSLATTQELQDQLNQGVSLARSGRA